MAKKGTKKAKHWGVTVGIILAVILALALSLGIVSRGFRDWSKLKPEQTEQPEQPTDITGQKELPDEGELALVSENGGGMALSAGNSSNVKLMYARIAQEDYADYGIATQAESAITLTATIKPVTADDKRVQWTVTPKTGNTNASDYITLNANGLTATVACKQAFDVQFIVTVKSLDNPEAKATCTLDYVQRVTGVTVNMPQLTSTTAAVTYTTQSSKYTIPSNIGVTFSNFVFNGTFMQEFSSVVDELSDDAFKFFHYPNTNNQLVNYTSNGLQFVNATSNINSIVGGSSLCQDCFDGLMGCIFSYSGQMLQNSPYTEGDLVSAFRDACDEQCLGTFDLTVSSTYGGKTYNSVTKNVQIWVDGSAFHIPVSSVSLSNGSIIF